MASRESSVMDPGFTGPSSVATGFDPPSNRILQNYEIGAKLGAGGQGKVYRARDTKTGELVAIKVIFWERIRSASGKKEDQLRREVEALKLIKHKAVLSLRDFLPDAQFPKKYDRNTMRNVVAIVTDLADQGDILNFIAMRVCHPLDEAEARYFFQQLVSGLHTCHQANVYHRDIKPENILVGQDLASVKIADFGLAAIVDRDDVLQTRCGTLFYMAPEVWENRTGYQGDKVDIWSLGVTLFVLVAGFPPMHHHGDWYYERLLEEDYERFWDTHETWREFSIDFRELVSSMLCVDPQKRITLEDTMNHPWTTAKVPPREVIQQRMGLRAKEQTQSPQAMAGPVLRAASSHDSADEEKEVSNDINKAPHVYPKMVAEGPVFNKIVDWLKENGDSDPKERNQGKEKKLKCSLQRGVEIVIRISPSPGGYHEVQLERQKGDMLTFYQLFDQLRARLTGMQETNALLASPPE